MSNKYEERIIVVGRFAYIYLFDLYEKSEVSLDDGDYVRIVWRFYWRIKQ